MAFRLLCDAIPFCYGPAAALETLVRQLDSSTDLPLEIDILATGSTAEFLERSELPVRLVPVDSEVPDELAGLDLSAYDAFLSVCNPVSLGVVQGRLPSAYVDFLLWMHSGPPACHFRADLYLAENYPGTADWVLSRGGEIPHLTVIPPLIQTTTRSSSGGTLLVGLGGLYSRLTVPGVNTHYAPYVIRQLLRVLEPGRFDKVLVAGPKGAHPLLAPLLEGFPGAEFRSLSHRQFLEALANCEFFLSHPGLYAPFEAMLSGVPTGFLPPSNYTQILQLRHFRTCGMAEHSFSWDDLDRPPIPADLPEPEGVAAVLREIAEAERSEETSGAFRESLSDFLALDRADLEDLGERQRAAASVFYREGPQIAARCLEDWLQKLAYTSLC